MSKFERVILSESLQAENQELEDKKSPEFIQEMVDFIDQQYKNRSELGRGRAGEVWIGDTEELKDICIKVIHSPEESPNDLEREFHLQDQAAMSGVRVAKPFLYAEGSDDKNPPTRVLAMETLPGRTLEQQIDWMDKNDEKWTVEEYKAIVEEIKEQVVLLHKGNIHHRDLHLRNLFFGTDGTISRQGKLITEVYPKDNDAIKKLAVAVKTKGIIKKNLP